MKSLYSRLAEQWDILFPPDQDRHRFLGKRLQSIGHDRQVVELGCGTGMTASRLASGGYKILATDPDDEMIRIARASSDGDAIFRIDDMIGTLEGLDESSTDCVLCLGNTLPHLEDQAQLRLFFRRCGAVLRPDGILVIQILNYRRIMKALHLELPDLEGTNLLFRREQVYDPETHTVHFNTELFDGEDRENRSHTMLPVVMDELVEIAAASGMSLDSSGSHWDGSPVQQDSPWLFLVFRRDS